MEKYAIIVAGGRIDDDFALRFLCAGLSAPVKPMLIAADRGLVFLDRHNFLPDLVVGDFDSVGQGYIEQYRSSHPEVEMLAFSWEKDYTDTEIAAREASERGCGRIDFLGVTGARFDHMIGAVQLLALLQDRGVEGRILDPCNRITMHREGFRIRKEEQWGKYVSFFSWGGDVQGVTLKGFHFPLQNGRITPSGTTALSNQIEEEYAEVTFTGGRLLMVESKDSP